jgi:peptidoglycan/xylan/chitin deacetylase (PgdA/CDA1 family)
LNSTKPQRYLRSRIAEKLMGLGALPVLKFLHNRGRTPIIVLGYHQVRPIQKTDAVADPFDQDLISATPAEFEWQMRYISEHYNIIPLTRLIEHISSKQPISKPSVVVTFDDGFSDNYVHAFPILKKYKIPATIFLATDMIDKRQTIWFQMVSVLMMRSKVGSLLFDGLTQTLPIADDEQSRRQSGRLLQRHIKSLTNDQFQMMVQRLRSYLESLDQADQFLEAQAITWPQAKEMSQAGVQFGSHTVTHGLLSKMDESCQRFEVEESKRRIESMLDIKIQTIAYPVGRFSAINETTFYLAARAGYRIGACYEPGINWANSLNPLCVLRQNVEISTTRDHFKALVGLAAWIR